MATFVELCCGLASVTLSMVGLKPPVSRVGAKTGYAEAILRRFPSEMVDRVVLVDKDPAVCNVLRELLTPTNVASVPAQMLEYAQLPAKKARAKAENLRFTLGPEGAAAWLMWTASSRGGIGGFKGKHKLRPSVDGFIPSRQSLRHRVAQILEMSRFGAASVQIVCADAQEVAPIAGAMVYIDPPYEGTQGYEEQLPGCLFELAERWASAGCAVGVSERRRLPWKGWRAYNITAERKGQCRRSMTRSVEEWLMVRKGKAIR